MQENEEKKDYKVLNADSMGNDIFVISDIVNNSDTAGWYHCMRLWGKWSKNQLFYNQNPPIAAMDSHIESATKVNHNVFPPQIEVDGTEVTGTKERTSWFINASKIENCNVYQKAENTTVIKGLTADNVKIEGTILPEPFKVGNYEVTQEMIDENPDVFKSIEVDGGRLSSGVYDIHPEIARITKEIYDIYLPYCNEIIGKPFKKEFTNAYINRNAFGDTCWTHADPFDYSLVVYLNPDTYDLRKWGGETLFFNDNITLGRGAVSPKGGTACLFKSDIPHKITTVSWEADFDRIAITYFLELEDD